MPAAHSNSANRKHHV